MQKLQIDIFLNRKNLYRLLLIIASVLVILAFLTATSYVQLAIATLFYPPLIYLALTLFPRKRPSVVLKRAIARPKLGNKLERETVDIADIDKRAFLKIIAGAGLSYLLYSIFTKKVETMLLGKVSGSGIAAPEDTACKTVQATEVSTTDAYKISEVDDQGQVAYFGFIDSKGAWFIMKKEENSGSFRYTKGNANFAANWASRALLGYDYYHKVFP